MQDLSTPPRAPDMAPPRGRHDKPTDQPTQAAPPLSCRLTEPVPAVSHLYAPADPALHTPLSARSCIQLGVMPWQKSGTTTLLACTAPQNVDRTALEQILGPVRLCPCTQSDIDATVTQRHGRALIAHAETSVAAAQSCRNMHHPRGRLGALGLGCLGIWAALLAPVWVLSALCLIALASMLAAQGLKVAALLMAPAPTAPPPPQLLTEGLPCVTLLIPLFRERDIATALLRRLQALRYPRDKLDVLLILEEDDDQTRATIRATPLPHWMRVVVVPQGSVRTKPRAMNYALTFAKGEIIGIYDAEDAPDPDQILHIAARFHTDPGVDCLQGILDYYNPRSNWLSRCFTIEYAVWFRLLLPGLVRLGFAIPLGGTTVFIRRHVLDAVQGWDAHNVTEDADLGLRLARHGYRTEVIATVTREEANNRAWPWVRQRSRWLKGYVITYLVHMRRPAVLWRDLGPWRFIGVQLVLLTAIVQFTLAPVLWTFWALPLGLGHPFAAMVGPVVMWGVFAGFVAAEAVALLAGWAALRRSPHGRLWPWVPSLMAYYPLGTLAMYKALSEFLTRPYYWDKTMHGCSAPDAADHPAAASASYQRAGRTE